MTTKRKINLAAFRRELEALNKGFRKYPDALKGVKDSFTHREVIALIKKFDLSEKKIEKHEQEVRNEFSSSQKLAGQSSNKLTRTKKLVRVYLPKEQRSDFTTKAKKASKKIKKS